MFKAIATILAPTIRMELSLSCFEHDGRPHLSAAIFLWHEDKVECFSPEGWHTVVPCGPNEYSAMEYAEKTTRLAMDVTRALQFTGATVVAKHELEDVTACFRSMHSTLRAYAAGRTAD